MVRNDHSKVVLSVLVPPAAFHFDGRWGVGQAGRQTAPGGHVTNLLRVRTGIVGTLGGAEVSTMFFQVGAGTAQDAATAVRAFWNDIKANISSAYTMQVENIVYEINPLNGQPVATHGTTNTPVVGTDGGGLLPPATQGLARWHTGVFLAGRELVGKTYIPGITLNSSLNGVPTSGFKSSINTGITNLYASGPALFGVYSRSNHQWQGVTSGSCWDKWAVLRSRRQ